MAFLFYYILLDKLKNMVIDSLKALFDRDLDKLKKEISSYQKEKNLWKTHKNINNSAGNLCLHIIGNLNHFIGHTLGNSEYSRDREAEFSEKNIPVQDLKRKIDEVKTTIYNTMGGLDTELLGDVYPINVFGYEMTNLFFLIHLHSHLTYHLGQINYHRRLIE